MRALFALFAVVGLGLAAPALGQDDGGEASAEAATTVSPDVSLREAYRREFAFLAGLKKQLSQRLGQVTRQTKQEEAAVDAEISGLESRLLSLEERVESLREKLSVQSQNSPVDDRELVDATLAQARQTLTDYGIEIPEPSETVERTDVTSQTIDRSLGLLDKLATVYSEDGSFFTKDGTKVDGKILYVGRVAAYGVAEGGAGALAPAGGGKLKVWKDSDGDDARALAAGESPDRLSMFIIENMNTQVDDGEGETALEHVASGGAIGWVIVVLGAVGLLLAGLRTFLLWRAGGDTGKLEQSVGELVQQGNYEQALEVARGASGAGGRVLTSLLPSLRSGDEDIEDVVSESLLAESRRVQRFGTIILVIAAVAPLLGLLGTVTGMISTFDVITKYGTGDPKMLSGGISTALVTTELGLIVAIPTLLLGNLLKGWGDGIESDVEHAVLHVVNVHKDARPAAGK